MFSTLILPLPRLNPFLPFNTIMLIKNENRVTTSPKPDRISSDSDWLSCLHIYPEFITCWLLIKW